MSNKEEILQAECYKWFHNAYPASRRMLFHVDNNSYNKVIGARKKALGVVKGVSDLIFIVENAVFFLELKVDGNTQSDEQIDFMDKVMERNHEYVVIRSFDQFKSLINSILA